MAFRQSLTELSERAKIRFYSAAFAFLALAGATLRIIQFPYIPPGVNVDEASSAYEAYSLALTGKDRWGNPWPAYFPSWGGGQNVLQAYLSIPFVRTMGLNIWSARMVMLICGILTVPLIGLALRPLGRFSAVVGMLLIAVVPWHFMMSRWGLESNLAPPFMLLGCALLSRALRTGRRRWILPCLLPFALALYAYGTTIAVLPMMVMALLLLYGQRFRQQIGAWLLAAAGAAVIAAPFGIFFLENYILRRNMGWTDRLPFATPLLPVNRLEQINMSGRWDALFSNLRFFISGFDDRSSYNMLPGYPVLLSLTLPLAIIGITAAPVMLLCRRSGPATPERITVSVFWCWAMAALPMLVLFKLNINRFNHFYLPAIALAAWAVGRMITHLHVPVSKALLRGLLVLWILMESSICIRYYFSDYEKGDIRNSFTADLPEAFEAAQKLPVRQLFLTDRLSFPYVYALYFSAYPPARFQREVTYDLLDGVYYVRRFGKFISNEDEIDARQPYSYLLGRGEFAGSNAQRHVAFANEHWEVGTVLPTDSLSPKIFRRKP